MSSTIGLKGINASKLSPQEYWENANEIPDLDVFIVNIHPHKIDIDDIPCDYDGIKDRHNDILFGDRSSHYDEKMANLVGNYSNMATEMSASTILLVAFNRNSHMHLTIQFFSLIQGS